MCNSVNMAGLRLNLIISLTIVLCLTKFVFCNVIVDTTYGKISGKETVSIIENETYYTFLGIPYAQPPVGKLRFMAPKPHEGWNHVLEVKKHRSYCPQLNIAFQRSGFSGDEDCLHLSVYTPKLPDNDPLNMPVIVFIYSEYFRNTQNLTKEYSPDFFMAENVVIASLSFRHGPFGFLSFQDDILPGNNAIRDIILALKWIKENIRKFGGNPDRVTLMGSREGAGLVDILLHSTKADGLFNSAILQSGSSWGSMYFSDNARDRAITLANEVTGTKPTSSSLLLSIMESEPAIKISELENRAVHADDSRYYQRGIPAFGPILEHDHLDAIITELPEKTLTKIKVPVMIGHNSRESIESVERYLEKPQYLTFADRDFLLMFPIRVNYHFQLHNTYYYEVIEEIKNRYFEEGYIKVSRPGEYLNYIDDIMTRYPIDYTVRKYTNTSSNPIFFYMFDYNGDFNARKKASLARAVNIDGTWGASVGDDLCYLFICNTIRKTYKNALSESDNEEVRVLKSMVRLWTNFAKTSNPTPEGDSFIWKPATFENKECLVISDALEMKTNLNANMIMFWDNLLAKYEGLAIDGVVKDLKDEL